MSAQKQFLDAWQLAFLRSIVRTLDCTVAVSWPLQYWYLSAKTKNNAFQWYTYILTFEFVPSTSYRMILIGHFFLGSLSDDDLPSPPSPLLPLSKLVVKVPSEMQPLPRSYKSRKRSKV